MNLGIYSKQREFAARLGADWSFASIWSRESFFQGRKGLKGPKEKNRESSQNLSLEAALGFNSGDCDKLSRPS
jgi:hypothetical protein